MQELDEDGEVCAFMDDTFFVAEPDAAEAGRQTYQAVLKESIRVFENADWSPKVPHSPCFLGRLLPDTCCVTASSHGRGGGGQPVAWASRGEGDQVSDLVQRRTKGGSDVNIAANEPLGRAHLKLRATARIHARATSAQA